MIAIIDTIYKGHYKNLQPMILKKPKDYMASVNESINFNVEEF